MIRDGVFGNVEYFKDLVDSVNDVPNSGNDWFLVRHYLQLRLMLAAVFEASAAPNSQVAFAKHQIHLCRSPTTLPATWTPRCVAPHYCNPLQRHLCCCI
jgi:hypothetical protein